MADFQNQELANPLLYELFYTSDIVYTNTYSQVCKPRCLQLDGPVSSNTNDFLYFSLVRQITGHISLAKIYFVVDTEPIEKTIG